MVDGISDGSIPVENNRQSDQKKAPNPSDVHAMASSLDEKKSAQDLGSIFSGQMRTLVEDKKKQDALELRMNQYKDQKKRAENRVETQEGRPGGDADWEETRDGGNYDELAQEVAEQILTGVEVEGTSFCKNEVIIRIKKDILEGCHIHLIGEADCLQVRLVTSNAHSLQTLIGAQNMLIELLEKHYDGLIRLSFHMTGQDEEK